MKQAALGILVIIMIVLVFSAESILAIMRVRTVEVTVSVVDSRTGTVATQEPTASAGVQATVQASDQGQAKAQSAVLTIRPSNSLVVHVHWDYHIGPRFPQTIVYAEILDQSHAAIVTDQYTIDCGSETLNCAGNYDLHLDYTGQHPQGKPNDQHAAHLDWAEGDYTLHVTRTYVGLKPQDLLNDSFHVRAAP